MSMKQYDRRYVSFLTVHCQELQSEAGYGKTFELSAQEAGRQLGVDWKVGREILQQMARDGVIRKVGHFDVKTRANARYQMC